MEIAQSKCIIVFFLGFIVIHVIVYIFVRDSLSTQHFFRNRVMNGFPVVVGNVVSVSVIFVTRPEIVRLVMAHPQGYPSFIWQIVAKFHNHIFLKRFCAQHCLHLTRPRFNINICKTCIRFIWQTRFKRNWNIGVFIVNIRICF